MRASGEASGCALMAAAVLVGAIGITFQGAWPEVVHGHEPSAAERAR